MYGFHFIYPHIYLVKFINARSNPPNICVNKLPTVHVGHAVAQLVEALLQKVAGSIPEGVIGFFH
jgi:hypothetical protein